MSAALNDAMAQRMRGIEVEGVPYRWRFDGVLVVIPSDRSGPQLYVDWGWRDWLEPVVMERSRTSSRQGSWLRPSTSLPHTAGRRATVVYDCDSRMAASQLAKITKSEPALDTGRGR